MKSTYNKFMLIVSHDYCKLLEIKGIALKILTYFKFRTYCKPYRYLFIEKWRKSSNRNYLEQYK